MRCTMRLRDASPAAPIAVAGGLTPPVAAEVHWQNWDGKAWTGRTSAQAKHVIAVRLGASFDADPQRWVAQAKAAVRPDEIFIGPHRGVEKLE